MKTDYKLICMSFDGEYVTNSEHESVESAWEIAEDLGSKWYFYPYSFVVKNKTVIDTCEGLINTKTKEAYMPKMFKGKRLSTLIKAFKEANQYCLENEIEADCYEFEDVLILLNESSLQLI